MLADFQICISAPLTTWNSHSVNSLLITLKKLLSVLFVLPEGNLLKLIDHLHNNTLKYYELKNFITKILGHNIHFIISHFIQDKSIHQICLISYFLVEPGAVAKLHQPPYVLKLLGR